MTSKEFKYCFDAYFEEIRKVVTYRCGDPELATDLVQDAFLKVWEKGEPFQEGLTRGLLYKISLNAMVDHMRRKKVSDKFRLTLKDPTGHTTEEQVFYKELCNSYESALNRMESGLRTVFLMSRLDGKTYAEISDTLEIGVKAVEKRMSKALSMLKKELKYEI